MLNKIDRLWAFAILFINGWNFALPVTSEAMRIAIPIWLTPVQVIHGIFIHELLLMIYLGFLIVTRGGYLPLPIRQHDTGKTALLIVGLGYLGILSNAVNVQPLREMGEANRFLLLAVYFILSIHWANRYGPTFVLRTLLLGILSAGAINLHYSFIFRWQELGGLPFLLGQHGPGGPLGISVILSGWLMLVRKTLFDTTTALASGVIGIFGASISYSKQSMLMAGFGVIAWIFVLWVTFIERRTRRLSFVMLAILITIASVYQERIYQYLQGVDTFIVHKFSGPLEEDRSVEARFQYFIITAEIMFRHPLLGVGYGGFYDATMATQAYKRPRSIEEDAEAGERGESNPHSSFLYYASANGIPGLLLTMLLFMTALRAFWRTFLGRGVLGKVLWVCLVGGYFIFGMTLPTLFNTSILYLPAAVAVALTRQTRSRPSPRFSPVRSHQY